MAVTTKRLGQILLACSAVMWGAIFGAFFMEWPGLMIGAGACAIALVSVVAWAGQLDERE